MRDTAISSTQMIPGLRYFLPSARYRAVMPAAAAVTCPEGKEKPSSAGAPMSFHHMR